jgi:protein translocase SecG subunit
MSIWFWIVMLIFIVVSASMVLIILVQRPQGGGLAGAFGGTVTAFVLYIGLAITLNLLDTSAPATPPPTAAAATVPPGPTPPPAGDPTAPAGGAPAPSQPTGGNQQEP